jgi:hypothetical protein
MRPRQIEVLEVEHNYFLNLNDVLWIRSGSGRIRIVLPHLKPDRDRDGHAWHADSDTAYLVGINFNQMKTLAN